MAKRDASGKFTAKVTYSPNIEAYMKFVGGGIADALKAIGENIANEIDEGWPATGQKRNPRTGRLMKGKAPGPLGGPPAVQSGTLRRSVGYDVVYRAGGGEDNIVLRVGSKPIRYAIAHELGVGPAYAGTNKDRAYITPVVNDWIKSDRIMDGLLDYLRALMKN
jgi:hypothetical protein